MLSVCKYLILLQQVSFVFLQLPRQNSSFLLTSASEDSQNFITYPSQVHQTQQLVFHTLNPFKSWVNLTPGWLCWKSTLVLLLKTVSKTFPESCERLFTRGCSDMTKGNGFKLKEGRLRLDIWKKSFTVRLLRHWNKVPEKLWMPTPESVQGWTGWGSG